MWFQKVGLGPDENLDSRFSNLITLVLIYLQTLCTGLTSKHTFLLANFINNHLIKCKKNKKVKISP